LQDRAFQVLATLLARPGEVVTREELREKVWGPDVTVDFDHSLPSAVNRIREALGDSAENPIFIETLPKRGYRFIAPIRFPAAPDRGTPDAATGEKQTVDENRAGGAEPLAVVSEQGPEETFSSAELFNDVHLDSCDAFQVKPKSRVLRYIAWFAVSLLASVALALLAFAGIKIADLGNTPLRIDQVTFNSRVNSGSPGSPGLEERLVMLMDGNRIIAALRANGGHTISSIDLSTGDIAPVTIPTEVKANSLADLSPDGTRLLIRGSTQAMPEQPLWIAPVAGGSAMRVGNVLAHDATWMADRDTILYAFSNLLMQIRVGESKPSLYTTLPGRAFALRWSPDRKTLRFTLLNDTTGVSSIWELDAATKSPHVVKPIQGVGKSSCCGVWSVDGSTYVFQAGDELDTDLWALTTHFGLPHLYRITNGPLSYAFPVASASGRRIYFFGFDADSGLYRYSRQSGQFTVDRSFIAGAHRIAYSRVGDKVAWTTAPGLKLWMARSAEGRNKIQVTPSGMETFDMQWSPDGTKLALSARREGLAWKIFVVDVASGSIDQVCNDSSDTASPSWSADGKSIVFVRRAGSVSAPNQSATLGVIKLRDRSVHDLPDSGNLATPRWSPDGKWIAAVSASSGSLMLFNVESAKWLVMPVSGVVNPFWSHDGAAVFVQTSSAGRQSILRVSVPDGQAKLVADSTSFLVGTYPEFNLRGLSPDDELIVTAKVGTGNLYTTELSR